MPHACPCMASIEHNQDIPICSHCRFYGNGCMRFSEAVRQKAMPDRPAQGLIRHGFLHSASASTRALWAHMPPALSGDIYYAGLGLCSPVPDCGNILRWFSKMLRRFFAVSAWVSAHAAFGEIPLFKAVSRSSARVQHMHAGAVFRRKHLKNV